MTARVAAQDISAGIRRLGLGGKPLCLHSSLRSFGWVEGGPDAVIDGILVAGCTLLVPTFSWKFSVAPPPHLRPARNGCDYARYDAPGAASAPRYDPSSLEIDLDEMGAIPEALLRRPGRVRGNHALSSFSAIGSLAEILVSGQRPRDAFAPLRALASLGGWVLLAGVGLTSMTLIHLAEQEAGRAPLVRWAIGVRGEAEMLDAGSCSDGFEQLAPVLQHLELTTVVGDSPWRAFPAAEVLRSAASAIAHNPEITRCPSSDCDRCPDSIAGGPIFGETV